MSLAILPMKAVTGAMMNIKEHQLGVPVFVNGNEKENFVAEEARRVTEELLVVDAREINGYSSDEKEKEEATELPSQSSSIGVMSSSDDDEGGNGDEVQSKRKDEGILDSLNSLEDSLPIKRGLSNFFSGKSKSFASLADAASGNGGDLAKPENPFNKRRRIHTICKASWRRTSCNSLSSSFSPFLSPHLVKEDDEEDEDEETEQKMRGFYMVLHPSLRNSIKNSRSHSLSDLQKL